MVDHYFWYERVILEMHINTSIITFSEFFIPVLLLATSTFACMRSDFSIGLRSVTDKLLNFQHATLAVPFV